MEKEIAIKLILASLFELRVDEEDEDDEGLLDTVNILVEHWPNHDLEIKWKKYKEYYEIEGCGDSMMFAELLDAAIEYAKTLLD